jgi:uncharacterized protein with von Willebrand factor type A (vWA) domain
MARVKARSSSSIPAVPLNMGPDERDPLRRGGEDDPIYLIRDPELSAAFDAAYEGWARKYPHLAEKESEKEYDPWRQPSTAGSIS